MTHLSGQISHDTVDLSLDEIRNKIKHFEYVPPGKQALEILAKATGRTLVLEKFKADKVNKLCVWCGVGKCTGRRVKYCSDDCKSSAWIHCNPQSPTAKIWVLINRQQGACRACGLSHEDLINKRYRASEGRRADWERMAKQYGWKEKFEITYHALGNNTGHVIQVDHIVPIFKGGAGIGLDNIQVICAQCHFDKTAMERRS